MVDIANFRFTNVADRARSAYDDVNALRQDQARLRAGNALKGGDFQGAAGELFGAGDTEEGARLAHYGTQRDALQLQQQRVNEKLSWETFGEVADRLINVYRANPQAVGSAFDQMAGRLAEVGETPEEIAQMRERLMADPESTLYALGAAAQQKIKTYGDSRGGVYAVDEGALASNFQDPNAVRTLREPTIDPLDAELKQARIDSTRAQVGQRNAAAAKANRTPAGGGGSSKRTAQEMSDAELMAIAKGGK